MSATGCPRDIRSRALVRRRAEAERVDARFGLAGEIDEHGVRPESVPETLEVAPPNLLTSKDDASHARKPSVVVQCAIELPKNGRN